MTAERSMVDTAFCVDGTTTAMEIGLLASWAAASSADTFRRLFPMVAPEVSDTVSGTELTAGPIEGSGTPERLPATLTNQRDGAMQVFAFIGAKDVPGIEPVRCFVYSLSALGTRLEQAGAGSHYLAVPATIMLVLPRWKGSEFLSTGGTGLSRFVRFAQAVDTDFSLRFSHTSEDMGDQFDDLTIIAPYDTSTRVEDKFGHVIDVATLEVRLLKEDTNTEDTIGIRHKVRSGRLQLPSDPFLRVSRLAGRIGATSGSKAGALFGDRFSRDGSVDPDARLCYPAGPC